MGNYTKSISVPGKSAKDLFGFVQSELERFLASTPLKGHKIEYKNADLSVDYASSMAKFTLKCEEECLKLDGNLSFLALPFKSKLDSAIERWVSKHFK